MAHRCVPAPFLTKTYQLVDDPGTDDIISWNETGTTFVVWKSAEFARDLLPNYFKHNNFSSFVRQLNTYGFRKIVPDRWEFANDFFRRGEKELLCEIHRRKAQAPAAGKSNGGGGGGGPSSTANSGEDLGSSSTSSPETKNNVSDDTTTTHLSNLSGENEKLRKDNQILSLELARTKKQCEDLVAFLSKYVNVAPDEINRVMTQKKGILGDTTVHDVGTRHEHALVEMGDVAVDDGDEKEGEGEGEVEGERDDEEGKCLKLFGVWLKGKKRGREEHSWCGVDGVSVVSVKEMRRRISTGPAAAAAAADYEAPWMKIMSSSSGETSKVCN